MTTNFHMAKFHIAVGSKNPVKIQSALAGFTQMFPECEFTVAGFDVASGVSDQPLTCQETLRGATIRANELKSIAPDADFFVGIEGGIEFIDDTLFASAWIVIVDAAGKASSGRSGSFALPARIKQLVESGMELGHANDEVFTEHNSKQQGGAVGSLTGGVITRQSLYEHAMVLALVAFRQEELFADGD
jgi:inosine/xanthosine triphosphatase